MRRGRRVVGGVVAAVVGLLALLPASASAAEADTTPPVLRSVAFSTSALTAAGSVTLILDATDDVAVTRASVTFLEDSSHRYVYVQDSETPLTLGTYFGLNAANGTYRAYQVRLTDAAGNYADYRLDGRYRSSPASAESTHEVDLAGPSVTLSGASDGTAPVLTALRPVTEATRVGEASTYAWAATDSEHSVASIEARFLNPHMGVTVGSGVVPAGEGAGTLSIVPSEFGPWELYMVEVVDSVGNRAFYYPDGQAVMEGALFPRTHGLPLATLGSTVAPGDFGATVVERPGRLTVALSTDVDPTHLSSIRVEASPSGMVRETPLGRGGSFLVDLPDLPNGVAQTLRVTLRSQWGDSPTLVLDGRPALSRNVTGSVDVTGDRRTDVLATRQPGLGDDPRVWVYAGTGTGRLRAGETWLYSNEVGCAAVAAVDVGTAGGGELLCRNDDLVTLAAGGVRTVLGSRGWGAMRWVDGGFSLNADAYPDVIAMNPKGELLLYPKTSKDRLLAPTRIGTGWQSMISVISAGDLTGDRKNDIAAVDAAGRLWLYPGNGKGGVTGRKQIGAGWQSMGALLPLRDFDGDGRTDLGGITSGGDLRLYRGTGSGGVRNGVVIGTGWDRYL